MCSSPHRANRHCVVPRIQSSRCFSSSRICSSGMPRVSASSRYLPLPSNSPNAATSSRARSTKYIRPPGPATGACSRGEWNPRRTICSLLTLSPGSCAFPSANSAIRRAAFTPRAPVAAAIRSAMPRRQACTASSSHSRTRSAIMRSAASAHETAASGGSVRMRSKTVRDRVVVRMPSRERHRMPEAAQRGASHPGRSRSDRPLRSSCALAAAGTGTTEGPTRLPPTRVTAPRRRRSRGRRR